MPVTLVPIQMPTWVLAATLLAVLVPQEAPLLLPAQLAVHPLPAQPPGALSLPGAHTPTHHGHPLSYACGSLPWGHHPHPIHDCHLLHGLLLSTMGATGPCNCETLETDWYHQKV